jgi:hypothetical protein
VTRQNNGAGFVLGVLLGWATLNGINYFGYRLVQHRLQQFRSDLGESGPWLLGLLAVGVVVAVVVSTPSLTAGALTGAGALLTAAGLAFAVLPIETAVEISRAFTLVDDRIRGGGYFLWDGSAVVFGIVLLLTGIRLWRRAVPLYPAYPGAGPNPLPGQFRP